MEGGESVRSLIDPARVRSSRDSIASTFKNGGRSRSSSRDCEPESSNRGKSNRFGPSSVKAIFTAWTIGASSRFAPLA